MILLSTISELIYISMGTVICCCLIMIGFCYRHSHPKKEKKKKDSLRFFPHCSKLFNNIYRYFGHNTNYSD